MCHRAPGRIIPYDQRGRVMESKLLIVNSNEIESEYLRELLTAEGYQIEVTIQLSDLQHRMATQSYFAVLLDVDSILIENKTIRDLVLANPGIPFLCTSRDRFHPELKDAICYHIFACINKPVDPDELLYWLRCIRDDQEQT